MKFYPICDLRSGAVTKQMLADLRTVGLLPANLGAFANEQHWIESTGVGAPHEGTGAKYWRDNSTIWAFGRDRFDYVMLDRGADGKFTSIDLRSTAANQGFSDASFRIYSQETANFYRQYLKHFPLIPRLVLKTMNAWDAGRLNFSAGIAEDYPIGILLDNDPTGPIDGKRATVPSNMALRFNPQTGQPEAFYWADYVREYPIDWTPNVPSTSGKLSDDELVAAASALLSTQLAIKDKATALRELATR